MKDHFSSQSDKYAQFRPTYPSDFFDYLNTIVLNKQNAWDCGTGNGQVAYELAKSFDHVFATDISSSQIDYALRRDKITYSVQPAEKTNFEDQLFDVIIIAQAIHWFEFERFYAEVRRTGRKNGWICILGYSRIEISEQIDKAITNFYEKVIGKYWDEERKYIDGNYKTVPFPFNEIQTPNFVNILYWTLEHLIGYLNTWSAVKYFVNENGYNPIDKLQSELEPYWDKGQTTAVRFPLLLRVGKISR